jgi:hypothetical protein
MDNTNPSIPKYPGTTIEGVNSWIKKSREIALEYLKRKNSPSYAQITMPFMPSFRMTRRITGITELDTAHPYIRREDSVGCVDYVSAKASPVYEFPYGAILDKNLKNISAAGRIVAADDFGWEMMRLIPAVAFTGQVAGTASALALDAGVSLQEVDVGLLQEKLESSGVLIHIPNYIIKDKNRSFDVDPTEFDHVFMDSRYYH